MLWLMIATLGGILPTASALALGLHGRVAGAASAVIGVLQFFFGAVAGLVISLLGEGPGAGLALAVVACGCALAGLAARWGLAR